MTRRDPFTEIEDLLERMGREFEELGGTLDVPGPDAPGFPGTRGLDVDVIEDDESITVLADLPGFDADAIDVELHDDALSIAATYEETRDAAATADTADAADATDTSGSDGGDDVGGGDDAGGDSAGGGDRPEPDAADDETVRYHRRERHRRAASRRVPLPEPVERDGATASYDDGVLTVTLPKRSPSGSAGHSIDVA